MPSQCCAHQFIPTHPSTQGYAIHGKSKNPQTNEILEAKAKKQLTQVEQSLAQMFRLWNSCTNFSVVF
jgi:hypothetical protein